MSRAMGMDREIWHGGRGKKGFSLCSPCEEAWVSRSGEQKELHICSIQISSQGQRNLRLVIPNISCFPEYQWTGDWNVDAGTWGCSFAVKMLAPLRKRTWV